MSARPTLSVITPSYNYGQFLPTTVESVARAKRAIDLEHVIVDDGSTDDSWRCLTQLAASHNLVIARQANRGLSATLNAAMDLAHGDWLVWLNADDLHLPWTYELFQRAVSVHPDADLVFGDTLFVDERGRVIRLVAQPQFDSRVLRGGYNMFHNCSVIWRRRLLPAGWRFDENMALFMDLDLWLTATRRAASIVKVDAPMSAFRRHPGQISASPRSSDLTEMHELADRHNLSALRRLGRPRSTLPSRLRHAVVKRLDGGADRQRAWLRYRGQDVTEFGTGTIDVGAVQLRHLALPASTAVDPEAAC
jgi:hypothetical protein